MSKTNTTPKFRAGKTVSVKSVHTGATLGIGRYVGADVEKNGAWHRVNLAAPRKAPNVRRFRACQITPV